MYQYLSINYITKTKSLASYLNVFVVPQFKVNQKKKNQNNYQNKKIIFPLSSNQYYMF